MRLRLVVIIATLTLAWAPAARAAESLSQIFKRVNPAVVVILTIERGYSADRPGQMLTGSSLGSGVVISEDGLIMTAAHVVQVADIVTVRFKDGSKVGARVVGSAVRADVALLRLNEVPVGLTVAELGDSDAIEIGDQVFVVGAPYGIDHTLTVGHLSGRRSVQGFADQLVKIEFLQTDAAINKGNSGGPMFNLAGEVVGIVSSISSISGGSEGLGFAASINTARDLLLKQQSIWTGMEAYFLTGPISKALNVPQDSALLVQRVAENSPSKLLGLEAGSIPVRIGREEFLLGGDIILEVQGIPVAADYETMKALQEAMLFTTSGRSVTMKILRGGKIVNLSRSETRPRDNP